MRISDWSSDVCSSDLALLLARLLARLGRLARERRWRCDRFQRRRGRKQGRRRAAAEQEQSRHPQQQHRAAPGQNPPHRRSEEHTSELQSLMRISYAVFCLKKKNKKTIQRTKTTSS